MRREHIYRDAIAIAEGGAVEVAVGPDAIDVLRQTGESSVELIEVKYAPNLREAIGQVNSYGDRYAKAHSVEVEKRVHLVLSSSRRDSAKESARINEHRGELAGHNIRLTTVAERPGIEPVYRAGGIDFASRQALERQVAKVKLDFLVAEYLSLGNHSFLLDLASAWRRVQMPGRPAESISVTRVDHHGAGMMMSVHGRVVDPMNCIRPLMMLAHYELLSMPVAV